MKTELPALHVVREPPSPEAFRAFFEALDQPAALCDLRLALLASNGAFERLCGLDVQPGHPLGELLQGLSRALPPDGGSAMVDLRVATGTVATFTVARRGETLSLIGRNLIRAASAAPALDAPRAPDGHARSEQALLEIGREVAGAVSEEELVAIVARGVKHLFPGRTFCVRIADPRTLQLTSLYAEGRLRDGAPEQLVFRRSAAEKTHLNAVVLPKEKVRITDDEVPLLFLGSVRAICAPLVASGQLFGVINVEYPEGLAADLLTDNQLLIQLANQVAVGVRNAKLIDELTFVRKYLEELLEHANALILVTDHERRVRVFNRQLAKLTGFSREDVRGKDFLQFIPDSEQLAVTRVLAASLRGEQVSNFETRVVGRGGREIRVSFSTSASLSPRGDIEGVIVVGQDLTPVKELERRVIQAEKMASLGQLAASVVHEINNPMTAVTAYADALLQQALVRPIPDAGEQEKLRKILDNAHRIVRFSKDLVSYARPAQDRPEPVEVVRLLDLAVSFCDHTLVQHGVHVVRDYGKVPVIPGVRGNLVQVFVNLITNACHALKPGGEVRLSTRTEGDEVVIRVADNGVGIAPENVDKVFEPFFTTKPDGKGTGLGLSIVQGIVEKHGGVIEVDSDLGVGTTFTVRLPQSR